jgi:hypothetical protein
MTNFQDNLLRDLMVNHGSELAKVGHPRARRVALRPGRFIAGAMAVATVATVGITTLGNSPAAFAVTQNPNGTVTVSIQDIQAIAPANAALQALGVRAKAVPMTSDCASLEGDVTYRGPFSIVTGADGSVTLGQNLPVGYTVLLTVDDSPGVGNGLGFSAPVKDPAPSCFLNPVDDPSQQPPTP